jgi:tetratricopeptide (TPR) repeat protein
MAKKIKKSQKAIKRVNQKLVFLFTAATFLFLVFPSFLLPKNQFQMTKDFVIKNPNNSEAHLSLATEFLKNNQLQEAEKEFNAIAILEQQNQNDSKVLGTNTKLQELIMAWQDQNPEEIRKKIVKWEQIVSEFPTLRDGYVYLSYYYYKLGQKGIAEEYLQKALKLDPNYEPSKELQKSFN